MADIKFSELPKATTSKDSDEIAILQDGVNKMIASPVLESKIINKTVSRVIEQGGASLNLINPISVVPTYADLDLITPTPQINDAYQVEAGGLVYVYTASGFQAEGEGFVVQPEPTGVVEEGNTQAVSGDSVYKRTSQLMPDVDITPFLELTEDSYIEPSNGDAFPAGSWKVTNFIDITSIDTLETNSNISHYYAYYDADKNYIGGSAILTPFFKKPKNASYIRMTITDSSFYLKLHSFGVFGKNKLNVKYTNSGFYIDATSGNKESLSSYSYSDFIPVKNGDVVRYKDTTLNYPEPKHLAIFNSNMQYVSGNTSDEQITITQDGFVILSTETTNVNKTVLTINDNDLILNNQVDVLLTKANIKGLSNPYICVVGKNGGDYTTINEAITYLKDICTVENKGIIYLLNGTYKEVVNIAPYYIDIVGINRDNCIILDDTGIYANSPLNISGRNSLSNLTALATNPNGNTPPIWAYALHADSSGEGKSYIDNCRFYSEVNAGVGLGTQNNQQYEFKNCLIETTNTDTFKGSLYMHNSPYAGDTNMSVVVRNCIVKATKEYSLIIDDANENAGHNDDTGTTFTFINNMLWSDINGKGDNSIRYSNAPTSGDIGQIKIGLQSYGNNVNKINIS